MRDILKIRLPKTPLVAFIAIIFYAVLVFVLPQRVKIIVCNRGSDFVRLGWRRADGAGDKGALVVMPGIPAGACVNEVAWLSHSDALLHFYGLSGRSNTSLGYFQYLGGIGMFKTLRVDIRGKTLLEMEEP